MSSDPSGSLIDRVVAWLRGLFAAGKGTTNTAARDVRRTAHEAPDAVRGRAKGAEGTPRGAASSAERSKQGLPDLADESSGGGRSTFGAAAAPYSTGAPAPDMPSDESLDQRSDFDDAAGDLETGEETYPPAGTDLGAATHVHDAVGGEDERADDTTDGTIDETRDADLRPGGTEGYQDREIPLQDEIIVDEGASSDEFDGDEVTPGDADNPYVTRDDVESAAEGYGDTDNTNLANTSAEGTSTLTGSTFTETDVVTPPSGETDAASQQSAGDLAGATAADESDAGGDFHVVERYNYGMGDLGVGAGATPEDAWDDDPGPDVTTADIDRGIDADLNAGRTGEGSGDEARGGATDASVSPEATRTEIESQSRGDAVNRSDEATQTPGFGDPESFDSAASGTTEPSRSATGNELDEDQDALGTTLDYAEESDAFSEDAANLSGEDELAVSDANVDFGDEGGTERVATFQSGTIAREGGLASEDTGIDEEVTAEAYADLPDEPKHETADDAGVDDFSGSDYPSDRRVDPLDGDDFTDAEMPDVTDLDSSAGDLDIVSTDASEQVDFVTEPVERTVGDIGEHVDQDLVGTSDEHVGGEEPEFAEAASRGTDETSTDDLSPEARALDESLAASLAETDEVVAEPLVTDDLTGPGDLGGGAGGTTDAAAAEEVGGMGVSDAGAADRVDTTPAGAVRGDGGTEAPAGYPVKGNANSMIYHLPSFPSYKSTKAEYYFATEQDAIAAGYRAPGNIQRGGAAAAASAASAATAITGDETSHVAPGEVAFDDRLTDGESATTRDTTGGGGGPEGDVDVPPGAVRGDGTTETPEGYPVKGNASSMIYHLPSFPSYKSTKAEFCFATEQDALNAGYRAPGKRNRDRKS